MDFNKVFLLSFTSNALEKLEDIPIEFNISSVLNDTSISKIINVGEDNWIDKNENIRNISKDEMFLKGLNPTESIKFINDFCTENGINMFFSPNYEEDKVLLKNIERESIATPKFNLKDFYAGINPYQKALWNHLYYSHLKESLFINFAAKERNKLFKESFKKIITIHNLNKKNAN